MFHKLRLPVSSFYPNSINNLSISLLLAIDKVDSIKHFNKFTYYNKEVDSVLYSQHLIELTNSCFEEDNFYKEVYPHISLYKTLLGSKPCPTTMTKAHIILGDLKREEAYYSIITSKKNNAEELEKLFKKFSFEEVLDNPSCFKDLI